MNGSREVMKMLNELLQGELAAINQYFLHASLCKKWGYLRLYKKIYDESIEEMKHAEQLIDRILFLDGRTNRERFVKNYDWEKRKRDS